MLEAKLKSNTLPEGGQGIPNDVCWQPRIHFNISSLFVKQKTGVSLPSNPFTGRESAATCLPGELNDKTDAVFSVVLHARVL